MGYKRWYRLYRAQSNSFSEEQRAIQQKVENFVHNYRRNYDNKPLRIYLQDSPNFGHQTNTLLILKNLISLLRPKKTIEFYWIEMFSSFSLKNKLHILIPTFESGDEQVIEIKKGFSVCFYAADPPEENTYFVWTGGLDNLENSFIKKLKAKYAMVIQPFRWGVESYMLYQTSATGKKYEIEHFDTVNEGSCIIDSAESSFYKLCYYFPEDMFHIPKEYDTYYQGLNPDDPLAKPAQDAIIIKNEWKKNKERFLILPIYGLHTLTDAPAHEYGEVEKYLSNAKNEIPRNSAMTIIKLLSSILKLYQNNKMGIPVLVLFYNNFDNITGVSNVLERIFCLIQNLFNADDIDSSKENSLQTIQDLFVSEALEEQKRTEIKEKIYEIFRKATQFVNLEHRREKIQILNNVSELANMEEKKVYLYAIGTVPNCYFNWFLKYAGLPPVFEGQGTSPAAIAIGKPYFQISFNNGIQGIITNSYMIDPEKAAFAGHILDTANKLKKQVVLYNDSRENDIQEDIENIYQFIASSLDATSEVCQFFQANKAYADDLKNDKLYHAIAKLQTKIEESTVSTKTFLNEVRPLEAIYAAIQRNIEDNILNFYAALNQYYVVTYLQSMTEQFYIKLSSDSLQVCYDAENYIYKITLQHSSVMLWEDCYEVQIQFYYVENCVYTSIKCFCQEEGEIDNIPWITFSSMGFYIVVSEFGYVSNYMTAKLKDVDLTLKAKMFSENMLFLEGNFEKPFSTLDVIYKLVGNYNFMEYLPDTLKKVLNIGVSRICFCLDLQNKGLHEISITLKPLENEKWIFIENPELSVLPEITAIINQPLDFQNRKVSFVISGDFKIGEGNINLSAAFPQGQICAYLSKNKIKFSDIIKLFDNQIEMKEIFEISAFSMNIMPQISYYSFGGSIDTNWNIMDLFEIKNLSFYIFEQKSAQSFYLSGTLDILPNSMNICVTLSACYDKTNGWVFSGMLSEKETPRFSELLEYYLGIKYDKVDFPLINLGIMVETNTHAWKLYGSTAKPWSVSFLDLEIDAVAELGKRKDKSIFGSISGEIKWYGIDLIVWYSYDSQKNAKHQFGITWEEITAEVTYFNKEWIAELHIRSGTSLGTLIAKMVSYFKNTQGYMLEAPWNVLNDINLSNFSVVYNFTKKTVGFEVKINPIHLGFATIEEIGLSYQTGEGVLLTLIGSFSWQEEKTLTWDVSDPETAPNPGGNKYFDLRLLAMGQHCNIKSLYDVKNVGEAITILNDLAQENCIPTYSGANNWFFGTDFGVLKFKGEPDYFITIKTVLSDANLYALSVRLTGEAAKVFRNFEFEILYKKISDNIGVFQSQVTLPDSIRYLSIGAYSLTLPVFGIAIYTNGDFKIDVGFPYNNDFCRSMAVEAIIYPGIPFIGAAGFYFAKLSQDTALGLVPIRKDGYYNPVIAFGFGMMIGFGKSLKTGILDAKFQITVFGIIEGVYAQFNSYEQKSESYFYLSGTVGISGTLYACVDFCVIKAYVDLALFAYAQIIFATNTPTIFTVAVSLITQAGLLINFGLFKIKLSFSFHIDLKETFMIGNGENAPLTYRINHNSYCLNWNHLLKAKQKINIEGLLVAALTATKEEKIASSYIITTFIKSGKPFQQLCERTALWIVAAFQQKEVTPEEAYDININEYQLDWLVSTYLESNNLMPISMEEIETFIEQQFEIIFHTKTQSNESENLEAVAVAMPASLHIKSKYMDIDYSIANYNQMTTDKLLELKEYFKQLSLIVEQEQQNISCSDKKYSVGQWIFADYFTFLVKQIAQLLKKELRTYYYMVYKQESMEDILHWVHTNSNVEYNIVDIAQANEEHHITENIIIKVNGQEYHVKQNDSLKTISEIYGISVGKIAEENKTVKDFFEKDKAVILPHLSNLIIKSLLTDGNIKEEFENIGRFLSRMYYYGIRFSTDGIFSEKKLPKECGLYALTGQQIPLPDNIQEDITLHLEFENKNTYYFDNNKTNITEMIIKVDSDDAKRIYAISAAANKMENIDFKFDDSDFRQISPYSASCVTSIEVEGLCEQLPYGEGEKDLKIWSVSESILSSKYISEYCVKYSEYNDAIGTTIINNVDSYGFASIIKFKVTKINKNTYVIMGSSQEDVDRLTEMVKQNVQNINSISLFFSNKIENKMFAEKTEDILFGITRSNLSYYTMDNNIWKKENQIINDKIEFIQLLWEALVTNVGGYYVYYYNKVNKTGLPDTIFDEYGNAEINVLMLYSKAEGKKIQFFKNAIVTKNNIKGNVLLETILSDIFVNFENDNIFSLCQQYNADITLFADNNKTVILNKNCVLHIERAKLIADETYHTLTDISKHFFVSKEALKKENEGLAEIIEIETAVKIPTAIIKISDNCFDTLSEIANYFHCSIYDIVYSNQFVKGIFYGQKVKITTGAVTVNSLCDTGVVSINVYREKSKEVEDYKRVEDAKEYLFHQYHLLSYTIAENQYFKQSNQSLALSPEEKNNCLKYHTSLPYYKFTVENNSLNCYIGIDKLLKLKFRWLDLYGNAYWYPEKESLLLTGYTDKLIALSEWTSIIYSYKIVKSNNVPTFVFLLNFDTSRYDNINKEELKGIIAKYQKLYFQLCDENGMRIYFSVCIMQKIVTFELQYEKLQCLLDWLFGKNSVYRFLLDIYENKKASVPSNFCVEFDIPINNCSENQIFEIKSSFVLSRNKNTVMGGLYTLPNILLAETEIPPFLEKNGEELSYYKFAFYYEDALENDDFIVRLLSGKTNSLYGIKISKKDTAISYCFGKEPVIWAVRPLSNTRKSCSFPIKIYEYKTGVGLTDKVVNTIKAENMDLDQLLKQFLEILDGILSPQTINAILILDKYYNAGNVLDNILKNKKLFAEKLSNMVATVLENQKQYDKKAIREYFEQQLLNSLSKMYHISSMIEYEVISNSCYQEQKTAPNLYGDILFDTQLPKSVYCSQLKVNIANKKHSAIFSISSPEVVKENDIVKSMIESDIHFKNTTIEHNITYIENIEGYYASHHLQYITDNVNPFHKDMGKIIVPLLLRYYPDKPVLTKQFQIQCSNKFLSLQNMFEWNYAFCYELDYHYPQDLLECIIETNQHKCQEIRNEHENFMENIVRFLNTYPNIEEDIQKYVAAIKTNEEEQKTIDCALAAIKSFEKLSQDVITSFDYSFENDKLNHNNTIHFSIQESTTMIEGIEAFVVKLSDKNARILIEPEKYDICDYDKEGEYIYIDKETQKPLSAAQGQSIKSRTVLYKGFHLLETQNAKGGLILKRNENIIPNQKINEDFVYNTGLITFESAYFPTIYTDDLIDISALSKEKETISQYLKLFFDDLLPGRTSIQMRTYYSYPFNVFDSIKYPVFMQPIEHYEKEELLQNCEIWGKYIVEWEKKNIKQYVENSSYLFDIILYSYYSEKPKPLLHMTNVYLPINKIT